MVRQLVLLTRSLMCDTLAPNSPYIVRRAGRENGAKKSAGRKISRVARTGFLLEDPSFLPPPLLLSTIRSTYASVRTATHAAHKRTEIVTIPTERGARIRIIFIRNRKRGVRAIFVRKSRRNPKNSNRFGPRDSYLSFEILIRGKRSG